MPTGPGTYGRKKGRPAKEKKENAREAAIRRSGRKTLVGNFMGKMLTGKASPHTNRDESPLGEMTRRVKKVKILGEKINASRGPSRPIKKAEKTLKGLQKVSKKYKNIFKRTKKP